MPASSDDPGITQAAYAGLPTLFRRPQWDGGACDLAFVGLPFDTATSNRPGARCGPRGVRAASTELWWGEVWPWGLDPFAVLSAVDAGDVSVDLYSTADEAMVASEALVKKLDQAAGTVIAIGGDHLTTLPVLRALADRHGTLGLIHFDAHADTADTPRLTHGSVFHHAIREGLVAPRRGLQVGIRTPWPAAAGMTVRTVDDVLAPGGDPGPRFREWMDALGSGPVFVSVDIDCLDPAHAPGTGTPIPGGLTTWHLHRMLRQLGDVDIVGADVVEVAPDLDPTGRTALAGAATCLELACALAANR